jgi:hypothetical protein
MKNIFKKRERLNSYERPAEITLENIRGFIQGYWNLFRKRLSNWIFSDFKKEQVIYRRIQAKECMELGECKVCGCEMIGKTMEDRACEGGCYPEMMNSSTWNIFKQDINIFK